MSRTFSGLLIGAVLLLLSGCAGISKGPFGQQSADLQPHGIVLPPGWPENTDENGGGRNWANQGGKIIVLGNAQDGGVPHVGCLKECCESARRSGQRLGPSCLAIVDMVQKKAILVEATPAIEEQLAMISFAGRPRKPVEAVLLTHAHIGHYTGLMHFGREVASTQSMPVYCTPKMAGFLEENGPWDQLVKLEQIDLKKSEPGQAITFEDFGFGLKVTPIAVKHRNEYADTVAWII